MVVAFIVSSLFFAMSPGIGTVFVVNNSIVNGRRSGVLSSLGIMTGGMLYNLVASIGVAAIIIKFPYLFNGIKLVGALYLLYVGIKSFKGRRAVEEGSLEKGCYRKGVLTNLANPKVMLFFMTFIPQFISLESDGVGMELFLLGSLYLVIELLWFTALSVFVSTFTGGVQNFFKKQMRYISGIVYILMGGILAFNGISQ